MQIKNRFTNAVIFECELPAEIAEQSAAQQLGYAVKQARSARANLAGAYLVGANLAGANLAGAYLVGANLAGANLAGAYLAGAYLEDANLARANLAGANLAGAYLEDANLARANLAGAKYLPEGIEQKDPPEPYLQAADPDRYAKRAAKYRERNPDVPVVENLDQKMLAVIDAGNGSLDMSRWHTCETTHCRAGWAITLAGERGKELESLHGPHMAGFMIYRASTGRVPHFFGTNERALEDIRARAAEQTA